MTRHFPYRRPVEKREFEIAWLGSDRVPFAFQTVRRIDLTEACRYAARQMTDSQAIVAQAAHGFHVKRKRENQRDHDIAD